MEHKLPLTDWSDLTAFAKNVLFKIIKVSHETSVTPTENSMGSLHHVLCKLSYFLCFILYSFSALNVIE